MILFATIGAKALYLLFVWLISATVGSWLSERKGYGQRVGLAFGMILSAIGLLFVLLLPGRPGSAWREEGRLPRRGRRAEAPAPAAAEGAPETPAESPREMVDPPPPSKPDDGAD